MSLFISDMYVGAESLGRKETLCVTFSGTIRLFQSSGPIRLYCRNSLEPYSECQREEGRGVLVIEVFTGCEFGARGTQASKALSSYCVSGIGVLLCA